MMAGVCLSVCLSVACLDLTREIKGLGSAKLAVGTYLEVKRSKVKVTGRLMLPQTTHYYTGRGHYNFLKTSSLKLVQRCGKQDPYMCSSTGRPTSSTMKRKSYILMLTWLKPVTSQRSPRDAPQTPPLLD